MKVPRHPIRSLQHRLQPLLPPSVSNSPLKRQALKRFLPDDAVIVEAGAYSGGDTVALARLFPNGQIHAFEPISALCEDLRRRTRSYSNVTTHQMALGDADTVTPMWIGGGADDASSSLLAPKAHLEVYPEISFDRTEVVTVTKLSTWARREQVQRIDGMWLDMQGHELAALKAAGSLLVDVRALVLEISAVELYEGAPLWPEVRGWLERAGFRIAAESWQEAGVDGDALAVRSRRWQRVGRRSRRGLPRLQKVDSALSRDRCHRGGVRGRAVL